MQVCHVCHDIDTSLRMFADPSKWLLHNFGIQVFMGDFLCGQQYIVEYSPIYSPVYSPIYMYTLWWRHNLF